MTREIIKNREKSGLKKQNKFELRAGEKTGEVLGLGRD